MVAEHPRVAGRKLGPGGSPRSRLARAAGTVRPRRLAARHGDACCDDRRAPGSSRGSSRSVGAGARARGGGRGSHRAIGPSLRARLHRALAGRRSHSARLPRARVGDPRRRPAPRARPPPGARGHARGTDRGWQARRRRAQADHVGGAFADARPLLGAGDHGSLPRTPARRARRLRGRVRELRARARRARPQHRSVPARADAARARADAAAGEAARRRAADARGRARRGSRGSARRSGPTRPAPSWRGSAAGRLRTES